MQEKERFELLLEDLHTNFKVVAERVIALDEKFDTKIDELKFELKHDIAVVDAKVMGLAKRVDHVEESLSKRIDGVEATLSRRIDCVETTLSKRIDRVEERLSREMSEVRADLADHRNNSEMHQPSRKRTLKKQCKMSCSVPMGCFHEW